MQIATHESSTATWAVAWGLFTGSLGTVVTLLVRRWIYSSKSQTALAIARGDQQNKIIEVLFEQAEKDRIYFRQRCSDLEGQCREYLRLMEIHEGEHHEEMGKLKTALALANERINRLESQVRALGAVPVNGQQGEKSK